MYPDAQNPADYSSHLPEQKLLEISRKIGAEKMAAREAYIAQYLEKTGHAIEDLELVQYTDFSEAGIAREICFLRLRGQI